MVEWGILGVLVLVFAGIFGHYARQIQGQSERAAVLSTLGALRTALVIDHVQRAASPGLQQRPVAAAINPFLVLQTPPLNYAGEMSVLQTLAAPAGSWVYDPQCGCIGYLPRDTAWAEASSDAAVLWFKVSDGPGPAVLKAQRLYLWQGVAVL
jgi:hypothetical protein